MKQYNRHRRILLMLFFMFAGFAFLIVRLVYIQVIESEELALWSVRQRSQSIVLGHGRGDIQDRYGQSLINSKTKEALVAFPSLYRGNEDQIRWELPYQNLVDKIIYPPHESFPFVVDRGEQGALYYISNGSLPGLVKATVQGRYGDKVLAAHTVGHIRNSDGEGQKGIELFFNEQLSGGQPPILSAYVDGRENYVEGLGIRLRGITYNHHKPYNTVLTVDYELQAYVEMIMDQFVSQGAVVVMHPRNGDILALASRPNYHPGVVENYLSREDGPFNNRITTAYQPGSVFKTILAAAAIEEDITSIFGGYTCSGWIQVEDNIFRCPHLHPESGLTLTEALAYSCNTTFIKLGQELGIETIEHYARLLGFGEKTGLPLGEDAGFIPSTENIFNPVGLANTSIGQELVETTPVQLAQMMSVIANGGRLVNPRLVSELTDQNGRTVQRFPPAAGKQVLSYTTVNKLKYMLNAVTTMGTGRPATGPDYMVGGKTGTAQSGRYNSDGEEILNYWFAGMAPLENSEVVIVVFSEGSSNLSVTEIFRLISDQALAVVR